MAVGNDPNVEGFVGSIRLAWAVHLMLIQDALTGRETISSASSSDLGYLQSCLEVIFSKNVFQFILDEVLRTAAYEVGSYEWFKFFNSCDKCLTCCFFLVLPIICCQIIDIKYLNESFFLGLTHISVIICLIHRLVFVNYNGTDNKNWIGYVGDWLDLNCPKCLAYPRSCMWHAYYRSWYASQYRYFRFKMTILNPICFINCGDCSQVVVAFLCLDCSKHMKRRAILFLHDAWMWLTLLIYIKKCSSCNVITLPKSSYI